MDALINRIKSEEAVRSKKCSCTGCDNQATHTWSGHPTCDDCATPSRKQKSRIEMGTYFKIPESLNDHGFYWYHEAGRMEICKLTTIDNRPMLKFTDGRWQAYLPEKDGYLVGPIKEPNYDDRGRLTD